MPCDLISISKLLENKQKEMSSTKLFIAEHQQFKGLLKSEKKCCIRVQNDRMRDVN
jgi:hypothetical protein